MIRFNCKCGKRICVPEEYAGRKGKCPQCGEICRIPQLTPSPPTETIPERSQKTRQPDPEPEVASRTPIWVWLIFAPIILLLVGFLSYAIIFRVPWDIEHKQTICDMCKGVVEMAEAKNVSDAVYQELMLIQFIGDHKIEDLEIRNTIENAHAAVVKAKKEEELAMQRRREAEEKRHVEQVNAQVAAEVRRIVNLMAQKNYANAICVCNDLLRVASNNKTIPGIEQVIAKTQAIRQSAQDEIDKIKAEERRKLEEEQKAEMMKERERELALAHSQTEEPSNSTESRKPTICPTCGGLGYINIREVTMSELQRMNQEFMSPYLAMQGVSGEIIPPFEVLQVASEYSVIIGYPCPQCNPRRSGVRLFDIDTESRSRTSGRTSRRRTIRRR